MNFYRVVARSKSYLKLTFLVSVFLSSLAIPSHSFVGTRVQNNRGNQSYQMVGKVVPDIRTIDAAAGWSTALSEDGSTLVVGAPLDNYDESGANYIFKAGAVYVYVKSGSNWVFQQKLMDPTRNTEDYFGEVVGISGDTIVVGAWGEDFDESGANSLAEAGAAYIFTRTAGTWSFQKKLVGSGVNGRIIHDNFGHDVAISGNTIAIGVWYQDYNAAGGVGLNAAGAVFVYTGSGSTWTLQQRIVPTLGGGRVAEARFGGAVDLQADTMIVGSYNQTLDESGGNSLTGAGAAYVFTRSGGVWTEVKKMVASGTNERQTLDRFGYDVAISGDTAVIGAHEQDYDYKGSSLISNAGAAYVFKKKGSDWILQQKLTATGINGRVAGDSFGVQVALDGDTVVIASRNHGYDQNGANAVANAGAAFVFKETRGVWRRVAKLVGSGTNGRVAGDVFSSGICIRGSTIVVGARGQDYDENGANSVSNAGAAFIFELK